MIAFSHLIVYIWYYLTGKYDKDKKMNNLILNCEEIGQNGEDFREDSLDLNECGPSGSTQTQTNVSPKFLKHLEHHREQGLKKSSAQKDGKFKGKNIARKFDLSGDFIENLVKDEKFCEECLEKVQSVWEKGERTESVDILTESFHKTEEPLRFVLYLICNSDDVQTNKKKADSLALVICKEFLAWLKNHDDVAKKYAESLTPDLKLAALKIGIRLHTSIFDCMVKIYQLNNEDSNYFLPFVNELLRKHQYKEAANCVSKLHLQQCFSLKEIVLPLIYQDKSNLVERYLHGCKDLQVTLVTLLDSYCDKGFDIEPILEECGVPGIRKEKLKARHMSKVVGRLVKLFKVDPALCPNMTRMKSMAGIRFLLYKKYIEKSMVSESWNELMENAVSDNAWLQEQLINELVSYNDIDAAAYWAKKYNVPTEHMHYTVLGAMENMTEDSMTRGDEADIWSDEIDSTKYHCLNLPKEDVHIVDSTESLEDCAKTLFEPGTIIGMDSEWKPAFGPVHQPTKVSLLQLATSKKSYILDMISLSQNVEETVFRDFMMKLFTTTSILKLGYGFHADINMLFKSYSAIKDAGTNLQRLVDVATLVEKINVEAPSVMQSVKEDAKSQTVVTEEGKSEVKVKVKEKGLSELVRQCLGKPLDKTERLSDWERRPLRRSQLIYAALDAYCLVEIYDILKTKVKALGIQVDMEPPLPKREKKVKKTKDGDQENDGTGEETKQTSKQQRPISLSAESRRLEMSPSDLAVVCDTMLQGLGKQLRLCGVDVKILDNSQDHDKAAEIARRERRVILTCGMPYQYLRSQVAEGMCYEVKGNRARDQVKEVLKNFNVKVTPSDIFSRCQVCNGNQYIVIPAVIMKQAVHHKRALEPEMSTLDDKELKMIDGTKKAYTTDSRQVKGEEVRGKTVKGQELLVAGDSDSDKVTMDMANVTMDTDTNKGTMDAHANVSTDMGAVSMDTENEKSFSDQAARPLEDDVVTMTTNQDVEEVSAIIPVKVRYGIIGSMLSSNQGNDDEREDDDDDDDDDDDEISLADQQARPPPYNPLQSVTAGTTLNTENWTLENGAEIQLENIPDGVLDRIDTFYCCATCGKVFWEGKHYFRVFDKYHHVLKYGHNSDNK